MVIEATEASTFISEERKDPILEQSEKRGNWFLGVSHIHHMDVHRVPGVNLDAERDETR